MTTLSDFGGGVDPPDPPYLKDVSEKIPGIKFGAHGLDNRLNIASLNCRRRADDDRYEPLDGYAFNIEGLQALARRDVSVIYVADLSEDTVYEYEYDQFLGDHGYEVNVYREQRCVPVKYATQWEGHARQFIEDSVGITWEEAKRRTK